MLVLTGVTVLVTVGFGQGWWWPNVHNGLLALTCTTVGSYVLHQRPGHREGRLLLAVGAVEAVVFVGRQVAHLGDGASGWWGWFGVWPVPLALGLMTLTVFCFPDGRLPGPRWRPVAGVVVVLTVLHCLVAAVWPVAQATFGVTAEHPLTAEVPGVVEAWWRFVALPSFVLFQLLWLVAALARQNDPASGRPWRWLAVAAALSAASLVVGLVVAGSPRAGLLTASLVPLAAGAAVVHAQHATAYSALTWLSRSDAGPRELPSALARAGVEALRAQGATVWLAAGERLVVVGLWPEGATEPAATTLEELAASGALVRRVQRDGTTVGALAVRGAEPLSRAEERLLDDLAGQASLVLDHLSLSGLIEQEQRRGRLGRMTPREQEVLALIARGLSNAAICEELHLSIKTVEPVVSSIFTKLDLAADSASNRRVLAALAHVRAVP